MLTVFLRRHEIGLQILLVLVAGIFLSFDINRQLVDYDEATYAKVIVDTLDSGNILTFQHFGNNWFEKPPLYLWLAMGSVKIFGEHEFAFRLPSILATILCSWLVYLLVRELTGDPIAAAIGFLVLLFSPSFFVYAREARLDSSVVAAMLAVLFFFIKGWKNEKYLFWVFPLIAIGFLLKSVIILLVIPIILFYGITYKERSFVKSKYLWRGFVLLLVLVIPWHLVESLRFGSLFWNDYIGRQVFQRAVSTLTGTNGGSDYLLMLVQGYFPWNILLFVETLYLFDAGFLLERFGWKTRERDIVIPLITAFCIILVFTFARTHLGAYIMPAFPFFAMSIAISWHYLSSNFSKQKNLFALLALALLAAGAAFCFYLIPEKVPPYTFEERSVGQLYKAENNIQAPLYALDWRVVETINYYGNTQTQPIDPRVVGGKTFKGPFYLITTPVAATYFFYSPETPKYSGIKLLYFGSYFALIYSDRDLMMPVFNYHQ